MRVELGPLAVEDLAEARNYYAEIDPALAESLRTEVDRVIERLEMFPLGAPPVDGFPGVRRARVRRFPYGVFYRADDNRVLILRVLHAKRASVDIDQP